MEILVNNFKAWFEKNAPFLKDALNPPATLEEIKKLEEILQVEFPEDFKAFYLLNNGQKGDMMWITPMGELLSLERIEKEWSIWKGISDDGTFDSVNSTPNDDGIKDDWYNEKWIPFSYDGYGNHLCLDLDPTDSGTYGQVITLWHDGPERELIADSFGNWLKNFTEELYDDYYEYDEEIGGIDRLKW